MHLNVNHIFQRVFITSIFFVGFETEKISSRSLKFILAVHKDVSPVDISYSLLIRRHSLIVYYFIHPCSYYSITHLLLFSLLFRSLIGLEAAH